MKDPIEDHEQAIQYALKRMRHHGVTVDETEFRKVYGTPPKPRLRLKLAPLLIITMLICTVVELIVGVPFAKGIGVNAIILCILLIIDFILEIRRLRDS